MSEDKPAVLEDIKKVNGTRPDHLNGKQNGYSNSEKYKSSHKSSSKDKHRDKDRDHKSSSSKHGSSSSSRDKDKHSSSKSHSSSHKSSSKDKDRSDKDRSDREKSKSDKNKERSSDKLKSSSSDKDRKSSKDKSSKEASSSSSKDKSSSSRSDKDKSRSDKHHSSSSEKRSSNDLSRDKGSSRDKSSHNSTKDKHTSSSRDKSASSKSPEKKEEPKCKPEIKEDDVDVMDEPIVKREQYDHGVDPFANVTASCSYDYSLEQFKEEPLDEQIDDSEEDIPLLARKNNKRKSNDSDDSEEEKPLLARKVAKTEKKPKIKKDIEDDYSEDEAPKKKASKTKLKKKVPKVEPVAAVTTGVKKKKKPEEEQEVWKWWEEEKKSDGTKWKFLEHKGPLFAPPYDPLPKSVKFKYDGKEFHLSEQSEEIAGFYAKMLDHDYTTKPVFNNNFFNDWRKAMNEKEKSTIKDLQKCDFRAMCEFFKDQSERNKNKTKEEKLALKLKNEEIQKEYGFCKIDGHNEKIGNFRIEPPGLFRGRGEHPKMGKLKQRVMPEDVIINCSKDSNIPKAPDGHKWKLVRNDNAVTWLASWTENVQGQVKYVMLNPSSKLKGEKDWQKYETARKLKESIDKIRNTYREEWKAKEMRIRQRAVALYFIDRLALRAGNEKDEDQADTVGCCSLRVEHIELHKEKDGNEYVVVFDFLGKDSIRYYNEVPVEKRVFKNLELFKENKREGDDLFDRLNTQTMNDHLRELMPNLTAKVFRTFNASFTLQNQLNELTDPDASIEEKFLAYNRANRAVAVLCNHQRAVPKGHQKSMEALKEKIQAKRDQLDEAEADVRDAIKQAKKGSVKEKLNADKKKKALDRLKDQLRKLEVQETDRDENKTIALGTSKLNYLDPRISIAWCKKNGVPIEKIYNKTQRDKFRWAIDMATVDYEF